MTQATEKQKALEELQKVLISSRDIEADYSSEEGLLGRGGYGVVYKAKYRGNTVAVKMLLNQGAVPKAQKHSLLTEARRLQNASFHPNIINLLGVVMEMNNYSLVLEYMLFGSSLHFIKTYDVGVPLLVQFAKQVVSAMAWLHSCNPPVKHLDLKADNVLINNNFDAKICDFGLSEWHTVTVAFSTMPLNKGPRCGTATHVPPEVFEDINKKGSSTEEDVYAFAITAWEIFSGEIPYKGANQDFIRGAVLKGQRPDLKKLVNQCPQEVKNMITRCWHMIPKQRPTFKELDKDIIPVYNRIKPLVPDSINYVRQQIATSDGIYDEKYTSTSHFDNTEEEFINCTGGRFAEPNGIADMTVYPNRPTDPTSMNGAVGGHYTVEQQEHRDNEGVDSKVKQNSLESFRDLAISTGNHYPEHSSKPKVSISASSKTNAYDRVPISETGQRGPNGSMTCDATPSYNLDNVITLPGTVNRLTRGPVTQPESAVLHETHGNVADNANIRSENHVMMEEDLNIGLRNSELMNGSQQSVEDIEEISPDDTVHGNPELRMIEDPEARENLISMVAPVEERTVSQELAARAEYRGAPVQSSQTHLSHLPEHREMPNSNSSRVSQSEETNNEDTHPRDNTELVYPRMHLEPEPSRPSELDQPLTTTNQTSQKQPNPEVNVQRGIISRMTTGGITADQFSGAPGQSAVANQKTMRQTSDVTDEGGQEAARQPTTQTATAQPRMFPQEQTTQTASAQPRIVTFQPRMFPPPTQQSRVPGQSINAPRSTCATFSWQLESEQSTADHMTSAKQRSKPSYPDQRGGSADRSETRPLSGRPAGSQSSERSTGAGAVAQPITISHKHAGGGFTTITMDPNSEFPPNFQVGNNNCMVVGGIDRRKSADKKKTKKCRRSQLTTSEAELSMDNIDLVAVEIGKDWKRLCRELDMSEADIEQLQFDFHVSGLYEIMYQGIQRWIQRNGRVATVRKMAEALWEIDRDDIALRLKEN